MKIKIYLLFIILAFFTYKQSKAQSNWITVFDGEYIVPDCNVWVPLEIPFDVSGLQSPLDADYNLESVFQKIVLNAPVNIEMTLTSPQGTTVIIGSSALGSWAGIDLNSSYQTILSTDCPQIPSHDSNETGASIKVKPIDSFSVFEGENPNGTWIFKICSFGNTFTLQNLSFLFNSYTPAPEIISITNTSNCQSEDGVAEIEVPLPKCSPAYFDNNGSYYFLRFLSLDGTNWIEKNRSTFTVDNLSAGEHTIYITRDDGNGSPDLNYTTPVKFSIGVDNPEGADIQVDCPPIQFVEFNNNGQVSVPLFPPAVQGSCGIIPEISTFEISYPDGTNDKIDPYDPTHNYFFNSSQSGKHEIIWFVRGMLGTTIYNAGCLQEILVDPFAIKSFNSPICDAPNPQVVTQCANYSDSQFHSVNISGLPNALSSEFGLRGLYLDANINKLLPTTKPYVDIVDPTGVRHRLLNPSSFPQYDPVTQKFIVYMSACDGTYYSGASDDIPFVENGTYKPMDNNSLNEVNLSGINPNGEWKLQVCATQEWSINCFRLDFGATCATIDQSAIQIGVDDCTPFVQVQYKDLNVHFCEDQNADGLPDYYIGLDGEPVITWDPVDHLKLQTTPGDHILEFGTLNIDVQGVYHYECRQFFNITVPDEIDQEAPVINDCPADQHVILDSNGESIYSIVHPSANDNCAVTEMYVNLIYYDGASDIAGNTNYAGLEVHPGSSVLYNIKGEGKGVFDFIFKDAVGNSSTCTITITSVTDPCENDIEAPVFTFCPLGKTVLLDDNGEASVFVTDPAYSENCEVNSEEIIISFLDGATNENGETSKLYNSIDQGKTYKYWINGEGRVKFEYKVTDKSGNSESCVLVIKSKTKTGPCINDNTSPNLTNCQSDYSVELDNATNSASFRLITANMSDGCGISSTKVLIKYLDGATGPKGELSRAFNNVGGGVTSRKFYIVGSGRVSFDFSATDPSGNSSNCTTIITAKKGGNDVLFNIGSECAVAGLKTLLPVRVTNFTKVGAYSFDLSLPANSGLSFSDPENMNMTNISYNILDNGDLRISWFDQAGGNVSLPDFTKIFDVAINASNIFNQAIKLDAKDLIILSDIGANASIEGGYICVGEGVSPAGQIKNIKGIAQNGVKINLTSGNNVLNQTETDINGNYSFSLTNKSERIVPYKNDQIRKGVEIIDVAKIRRHFLETAKLENPYNQIAADVNKDGRINVLDVAFTNRVFLKKKNSFPNNTSWRYLPENFNIDDNPLDANNPEFIKLDEDGLDFQNLNFVSIKTGDVDNSALITNEKEYLILRNSVALSISDTVVDPSQSINIPIYISGGEPISLFSFTMNYDTTIVKLEEITSSLLSGFSAGNYNDLGGNVLIGWDHPNGNSVDGKGVFLNLVFSSKVNSGNSQLQFSDIKLYNSNFELYDVNFEVGNIDLSSTATSDQDIISDLILYPNPIKNDLFIGVQLNYSSKIKVSLNDILGRSLQSYISDNNSDYHKVHFKNIKHKGIIIVKIESDNFQKVYKVISN